MNKKDIIDLGHNIIIDSKRRTLYYDEESKKGYQLDKKGTSKIRLYNLRFYFCLLAFFISFIILRGSEPAAKFLVCLGIGLLIYFVITLYFKKVFLPKLPPFKVSQQDFQKLYQKEVLIQKRSLGRLNLAFVVVYGLLVLLDLLTSPNTPIYIFGVLAVILGLLLFNSLKQLLVLREQIKLNS